MARANVKVDTSALRRLRADAPQVLAQLGQALRPAVGLVVTVGQVLAPEKSGSLKGSTFVDGPHVNPERLSVTVTGGFEHPQAGPIHEGTHWGAKTEDPPPHFLRRAFRSSGATAKARRDVRAALRSILTRYTTK